MACDRGRQAGGEDAQFHRGLVVCADLGVSGCRCCGRQKFRCEGAWSVLVEPLGGLPRGHHRNLRPTTPPPNATLEPRSISSGTTTALRSLQDCWTRESIGRSLCLWSSFRCCPFSAKCFIWSSQRVINHELVGVAVSSASGLSLRPFFHFLIDSLMHQFIVMACHSIDGADFFEHLGRHAATRLSTTGWNHGFTFPVSKANSQLSRNPDLIGN
jgi:hypothetical protein